MGSNRRYPNRTAADIDRRIEQVVTRPEPASLSDAELDKPNSKVTAATEPIPVRAWVRFPEAPIRATARALAWTDRAVLVEWETADRRTVRAWVWASAVERITPIR